MLLDFDDYMCLLETNTSENSELSLLNLTFLRLAQGALLAPVGL